jgi:hypothetical protein
VAKRLLVSVVQATLQTGRLKVAPGLGLAEILKKELFAFRVRISVAADETYGAAEVRDGEHDDLVLAVAMAAWMAENVRRPGPVVVGGPDKHHYSPFGPGPTLPGGMPMPPGGIPVPPRHVTPRPPVPLPPPLGPGFPGRKPGGW